MNQNMSLINLPVDNIQGISADSRKIKPGYAFIAIKGALADGHDYIPQAIENGAILIISETLTQHDALPVHTTSNARQTLVDILKTLYPNHPENLYAITGTNGKTSVADFMRQLIAAHTHKPVISIGTLGIIGQNIAENILENAPFKVTHTTPDPEILYPTLDYFAGHGVTDCVIEASSHGLDQDRLAGLTFNCGLFTNFTSDHMDYHKNEAEYFGAKMRLFTNHLHQDSTVILFKEQNKFKDIKTILNKQKTKIFTIGGQKSDYNISNFNPHIYGSDFELSYDDHDLVTIKTSLLGNFQSHNLVMAFAGVRTKYPDLKAELLETLKSVDGRLDFITSFNKAAFYVDYAHTSDALEKALLALKPHCAGNLICVFGCGGDRDRSKRPIMGQVASKISDIVIVTDDNPRTESPKTIRAEIIQAIDQNSCILHEISDRRQAINQAISMAKPQDIILIAGKGHENGQIIQDQTLPFKDAEVIRQRIKFLKRTAHNSLMTDKKLLWTQTAICAITGGSVVKPFNITGISIDSRTTEPGDLFIPLRARRDGHFFIKNAINNGAAASLIVRKPRNIQRGFPVVYVKNTLGALENLGRAARNRMIGTVIGVTGTAGKTTIKHILSSILAPQGLTHASDKSFNNHIGVPLSLARMPADTEYAIFEIGMNKPGEIMPLTHMVRPNIAIITTVGDGHREAFASLQDIARAKAEIIDGVTENGSVILNRDIDTFEILKEAAQEKNLNIITFGTYETADIRLLSCEFNAETQETALEISAHGQALNIKTHFKGTHNALNICAIMGALTAAKADITAAIEALAHVKPAAGRGEIVDIPLKDSQGSIQLIDESYNANPLSMAAALQNMMALEPVRDGKKIIVLGAMYELGEITQQAHSALAETVKAGKYDAIYLIGQEMNALYDALGEDEPAILAEKITDIQDEIISVATDGSVIMVKGSNGVKLHHLIEAFKNNVTLGETKIEPEAQNDMPKITQDDPQSQEDTTKSEPTESA